MALYNNSGKRVINESANNISQKMGVTRAMSSKEYVGYACDRYNAQLRESAAAKAKEDADFERSLNERAYYLGRAQSLKNANSKYGQFLEDCRSLLVNETLYKITSQALPSSIKEDTESLGILRNLVTNYVTEEGAFDIIAKMKRASSFTSECALDIDNAITAIKESTDPDDEKTFQIKVDVKDKFFDDIDDTDIQNVDAMITDRVNTAINDFIASNSKNRMDIKNVLQSTEDKIATLKDEGEPEDVQESYVQLSKRVINDKIRSRKKNVFDALVTSMCESTTEDKVLQEEFIMEGSKLNVPKIVDRTKIMYTFMEAMNTTRIQPATEEYINSVLESMSKK